MSARTCFTLLLFAAPVLVLAQDPPKAADDPVAAQLLKDKEAYAAALEKAKEGMLKAFDKSYEAVKANKSLKIETQLAQLEKLEAERKAFDESGTPPSLPVMKVALSEYRTAVKRAEVQGKAAFEKAAKAYRDRGDIKAAAAVLEEMKEFLASASPSVYVISSRLSGKVLGVGGTDDGSRLVTANYAKGDQSQLWKSVAAADGWVYIENVKTGLVLTVGGKNNGAEAHIARKKDGDGGQLWKTVPVAGQTGAFKIGNKGSGKLIGIDGKSKNAGARILLWTDENDASEWFNIAPPR